MEIQKPKIEFYVVRSFGAKFSATSDFISENWKQLFKYVTYFLLPVCLVQALSLNTMLDKIMQNAMAIRDGSVLANNEYMLIGAGYLGYMLAMCIGMLLLSAIVYGLMDKYDNRANRLNGLTWAEFRPTLSHNIKRGLLVTGAFVVLSFISGAVMVLSLTMVPLSIIPIYLAFVVCMVPLSLLFPIYIMEDISIVDAVSKAFRLGFKTWGGIFALLMVVGIIAYIVMTIVSMPVGIGFVIKAVMFTDGTASTGFVATSAYTFLMYLLGILQSYGMYISYTIVVVALGYQYAHAAEKVDGVSVEKDIDNFEAMKDENIDAPELPDMKNEFDDFNKL